MSQTGLHVRGLRKSYKRREVITDVSLNVERGQIVALLGPNGSGKTTSFYAIAGLVRPDAGKVVLDGRDVSDLPIHRRARLGIGYLPQEMSIFRGMTVEQNIRSVLEIHIKNKALQQSKLNELLADFALEHLRNASAIALSGGERRRAEIARCLAANPNYVLLDEPFAGVDPIAVDDIRTLMTQLKSRDIGVLITDHNVRETLAIVDQAYVLHEGKVLRSGSAQDIISDETVQRVYLGDRFQVDGH